MNKSNEAIYFQEALDLTASRGERRQEPRTRIERPVYVRPADQGEPRSEEIRTMNNFSRTGFYFITARIECYQIGMPLYVIPAFGYFNFEYLGEVVRIEELPFGEYGIAVQLIRVGRPALNKSNIARSAFQFVLPIGQQQS